MATTLKPIDLFVLGIRTSTGAVAASGLARFFNPGTLVEQVVYQDDAGVTPFAQPITLNAAGQKAIYALEPVRCIVKDSTDTTTLYDGVVNLQRMDAGYYTDATGTEQTQESFNNSLVASLGAVGGQIKVTGTATAQNAHEYLSQRYVPVTQFGAIGDGLSDDRPAIQATIDYVESQGGGVVFLPEGTYKITSGLTIDTAGVSVEGVGRGISVVKNFSTTGTALTVNLGSAIDAKLFLRGFSVTADTTSSGTGIAVTNGDNILIQDVAVGLHRTGISVSAVSGARLDHCKVDSTDDNAAAVGVAVGDRTRMNDCEIFSGTDNGTGISGSGGAVRVSDCYVDDFATGISLSGGRCIVRGGHIQAPGTTGIVLSGTTSVADGVMVTGGTTGISLTGTVCSARNCYVTVATTGVSLGAANTSARDCHVVSATTGYSVGAFAGCSITGCYGTTNTTDISVNASATNFHEHNPSLSTYSNTGSSAASWPARLKSTLTASTSTSETWTPTHSPYLLNQYHNSATSAVALTIGNPTTTNAQADDLLWIVLYKTGANAISVTMSNLFRGPTGGSWSSTPSVSASGNQRLFCFRWTGSYYALVFATPDIVSAGTP